MDDGSKDRAIRKPSSIVCRPSSIVYRLTCGIIDCMASEQTFRCPTCGYEYQAWVKVCPDCGSPIEARPGVETGKGKLKPNEDPHWSIVTSVPNAILGTFIESQLEDAGIPVLMFRARSADVAE